MHCIERLNNTLHKWKNNGSVITQLQNFLSEKFTIITESECYLIGTINYLIKYLSLIIFSFK